MILYSINGAFGQVRSVTMPVSMQKNGLFWTRWVGWHKCNELYRISRPKGVDTHLFLFTVGGCGSLRIRQREYRLTPGTIAFVPRNVSNAYQTPKDGMWEFYWLHPDGEASNQFLNTLEERGVYITALEDIRTAKTRIERIMALCSQQSGETPYQISSELSFLFHDFALRVNQASVPSLSQRAMNYLEQHYREPVQLEAVAAELYVSVPHLIRMFKKEIGCTPHQFLLQHRLTSSLFLLKFSDLRIEEIAAEAGFSSSSHFISLFRRQYGCTPGQYRENGK